MTARVSIIASLVLSFALVATAGTPRTPRSIGPTNDNMEEQFARPAGADYEGDTLQYGYWETMDLFFNIPDEYDFGDKFYNVRFTPPYAPFYLLEAHIALFDYFGRNGEPGMRVIVWYSGYQDEEPGFPTEIIDSIDMPFDSLIFSNTNHPAMNIIDFLRLEDPIYFEDTLEFHIGIDLIGDPENDTLAVYTDDGERDPTDRSAFWNGEEEKWERWAELQGVFTGYNLAIRAVIAPQHPDSIHSVPTVLNPSTMPAKIDLQPAWPNPFNQQTRFLFDVLPGVPYNAVLYDQFGREISTVASGMGQGRGQLNVFGGNFSAGTYYLQLSAGDDIVVRKLIYLR